MADTAPSRKRVGEHVYQLTLPQRGPIAWQVPNSFLIGDENEAVLVDSDYPLPEAKANTLDAVRALGPDVPLTNIFLSHSHPDHLGGAMNLKRDTGARVHIHPNEKPHAQSAGVEVDADISDNQTYAVARTTLRMVHTPGHSPGHVCYYLESERALFTADTVLGRGTSVIAPPFGNMIDYLATLHKLLALDLAVIYPGHGDPITKPKEKLTEYIEHRHEREKQIIGLLQEGLATPDEMVPRIYKGYHPSVLGAAAKSVLAQLEKLEAEGRAVVTDGRWRLL